jgi:hypothetical protein
MSLFQKMASKISKVFKFSDDNSTNNFHQYKKKKLSNDKQAELEALYYQLLNKSEYITSGKLQFLGLDKIKTKMGKKWAGLQEIVYETAEEVISKNISTNDIHFLYKEDSYVIIFTKSTMDEINEKVTFIAEEVRRRLFALDEDELKQLEIKQEVTKTETKSFLDNEFPEMLDYIFQQYNPNSGKQNTTKSSEIGTIEIGTQRHKQDVAIFKMTSTQKENLEFAYLPTWDVKRSALTTYICVSKNKTESTDGLNAYQLLFHGKSASEKVALDIAVLENIIHETELMERDGRKLVIMCPVHYETLYQFESYEAYKDILQKIKSTQTQFFNLLVMSPENNKLPAKDTFWFIKPLKAYCYNIFALVPAHQDLNYQMIKASGLDALGMRLNNQNSSEAENISQLNNLASKAKYFKIPKIFALDVSSLSVTTSLVCSGYDYLSGLAIHEQVSKPDTVHKYRYEELLSDIIKQ